MAPPARLRFTSALRVGRKQGRLPMAKLGSFLGDGLLFRRTGGVPVQPTHREAHKTAT